MGVREAKGETHLKKEVERLGGVSRKWVSPGRTGVPDQIIIFNGKVVFVEVKTTDGIRSSDQAREHERLTQAGASVITVYGKKEVNSFIEFLEAWS